MPIDNATWSYVVYQRSTGPELPPNKGYFGKAYLCPNSQIALECDNVRNGRGWWCGDSVWYLAGI